MFGHFFEHHGQELLPRQEFLLRLAKSVAIALSIMSAALGIGVLGYHHFQKLSWIDSLLEASMILGGMGPIHAPENNGGKLFASFYALFSGIVFVSTASVLVAPVLHRMLHWLQVGHKRNGGPPATG
jgi:hypothetical protein